MYGANSKFTFSKSSLKNLLHSIALLVMAKKLYCIGRRRSPSQPRCPQFQDRALSTASELNAMNRNFTAQSHAQEQRLARISTSIVWLFILCNVWRMIPTVYEYWHSENGLDVPVWPYSLVVIEHISHSLILFNSAVNFLIYVFM